MNNSDYDNDYNYKRAVDSTPMPVSSKEQLGQELLRTFARISDPDQIVFRTVIRKIPILKRKMVLDETGEQIEVETLIGWKKKKFEIPILTPPKYRELITDDIARAFLSKMDFDLYLDNGEYCQSIRSFSKRYGLDLALHHNHFVGTTNLLVCGSGAVEGQRPTLAKTDIAKAISQQNSVQEIQDKAKKNKGFMNTVMGGI